MTTRNRSVPADTVVPHLVYQDLAKAIPWLERAFGFREHFRYGGGPNGAQMFAGKAVIMVRQARDGERTPREAGFGTQSADDFCGGCGWALRAREGGGREDRGRAA
jgi:hypothetical protein